MTIYIILERQDERRAGMEFTGVYHKTSEQMSYALNDKELVVNLKTGYDVKQVFIIHGDP